MRTRYNPQLPQVRKALRTRAKLYRWPHRLVDKELETDDVDVFIRQHENEWLNLSRLNLGKFSMPTSSASRKTGLFTEDRKNNNNPEQAHGVLSNAARLKLCGQESQGFPVKDVRRICLRLD
jgi:hypothetical protein